MGFGIRETMWWRAYMTTNFQGLGIPIVTLLLEGGIDAIRIIKERLRCGIFGFCFLLFPQNERKMYKLRQLFFLSQFVYFLSTEPSMSTFTKKSIFQFVSFSLVLREQEETKNQIFRTQVYSWKRKQFEPSRQFWNNTAYMGCNDWTFWGVPIHFWCRWTNFNSSPEGWGCHLIEVQYWQHISLIAKLRLRVWQYRLWSFHGRDTKL